MRIELVIDELVLHGFDPRHRHAIGDAVKAELTRLMAGHAVDAESYQPVAIDHVDAGEMEMAAAPGQSAADPGRDIARAIAGAVPLERFSFRRSTWRPALAGLSQGPPEGGHYVVSENALDPPSAVTSNDPAPRQPHERRGDA